MWNPQIWRADCTSHRSLYQGEAESTVSPGEWQWISVLVLGETLAVESLVMPLAFLQWILWECFGQRILETLQLDRVYLVWEWNESKNFKETKTIHTVSVLRFLSISLLILLLSEQTATNMEWWLMPTQFSLENSTLLRRAASLWYVSVFTGDSEPSQSPLHLGHPQLTVSAVHSLTNFLHDRMSALKNTWSQQPSSPSPYLN
jgi:hypothetical protein